MFYMSYKENYTINKQRKKDAIGTLSLHLTYINDYARSTLPDLRHEVHTYVFFAAPFTMILTDFTLAFHILLDLL